MAIILNNWLDTPEAKRLLDSRILASGEDAPFLKNRIVSAFIAGWQSAEAVVKDALEDALDKAKEAGPSHPASAQLINLNTPQKD